MESQLQFAQEVVVYGLGGRGTRHAVEKKGSEQNTLAMKSFLSCCLSVSLSFCLPLSLFPSFPRSLFSLSKQNLASG